MQYIGIIKGIGIIRIVIVIIIFKYKIQNNNV